MSWNASEGGVEKKAQEPTSAADQVREIIALTVFLREQEKVTDAADERVDWLRRVASALITQPSWWSLLPKSWRMQRQRRRLRAIGLFDGDAYLARYPDVASTGADPLLHYLLYGMKENRLRPQ